MASQEQQINWLESFDEAIHMPGNVGDTYSHFATYSLLNYVRLRQQGVYEPVGTLKQWNSVDHKVIAGSKAKTIIVPVISQRENDQGEMEAHTWFKPVRCIFGVSETRGPELPAVEPRGWDLEAALDRLKITRVPFQHLDGNLQGYSYERKIAVSPVAKYAGKTLFHEVVHVVDGHTSNDQRPNYEEHRGIRELIAEAGSMITRKELGLSTPEEDEVSRGYCQHWMQGEEPPISAIKRVFKAVDTILRAGRDADIIPIRQEAGGVA